MPSISPRRRLSLLWGKQRGSVSQFARAIADVGSPASSQEQALLDSITHGALPIEAVSLAASPVKDSFSMMDQGPPRGISVTKSEVRHLILEGADVLNRLLIETTSVKKWLSSDGSARAGR